MHPSSWRRSLSVLVLVAVGLAPGAWAEEEEPAAAEAESQELREATAEEAKPLAAALKKAARKKKAAEVMPALEAIAGLKHESFESSLLKLLTHENGNVAQRAADMLDERAHEKLLKKLWKNGWKHKANDKRFGVKGRVLRTLGKQGYELKKPEYAEVERDWRWMIGNPQEHFSDGLVHMAAYFGLTKDKRHCKWLAQELDEPFPANPNSASNPPAEWWERRWKMWRPTKPAVVAALKQITGQEFDRTEEAKAWFEANEKTFGFRW